MFRKSMLAIAAVATIGIAALVPTAASAKHFGFHGFGFRGIGITVVGPVVHSCWRERWVETRRGYLKRILVNVCGYY